MKTLLHFTLIFATSVASAAAAPVQYTINFTTSGANLPSYGGFSYDPSAAPGSRFSSFLVQFGIYTIDFTSAFNSTTTTPSGTGCNTAGDLPASLIFHTGVCRNPNIYTWFFSFSPGAYDSLSFKDQGQGGSYLVGILNADTGTGSPYGGTGSFSVSATPEPSSLGLLLAGTAALAFRWRAGTAGRRLAAKSGAQKKY